MKLYFSILTVPSQPAVARRVTSALPKRLRERVIVMGVWTPLIGFFGVLAGGWLTAWLTDRREDKKRRVDYLKQQLSEFYGPMLGLWAEIHAVDEARVKLLSYFDNMSDDEVKAAFSSFIPRILSDKTSPSNAEDEAEILEMVKYPKKSRQYMHEYFDVFFNIPAGPEDADTPHLPNILIYEKMIDTFRDKIWLAEPNTRVFLGMLITVYRMCSWLRRPERPPDSPDFVTTVVAIINEMLAPLHKHLEETHDRLQGVLAAEPASLGNLIRNFLA